MLSSLETSQRALMSRVDLLLIPTSAVKDGVSTLNCPQPLVGGLPSDTGRGIGRRGSYRYVASFGNLTEAGGPPLRKTDTDPSVGK